MKRREFITLVGGLGAAWPLVARTQQPSMPVIGYLSNGSPEANAHLLAAFRQGMEELGYVEDRNVHIEFRWAQGQYDRLPALAADLVRRQVTMIAAVGGAPDALAARAATTSIPTLFVTSLDLIKAGIIASFNRPGGNATGMYLFTAEVEAKKLQLLHELVPGAAGVAALVNPSHPMADSITNAMREAAGALGLQMHILAGSSENELAAAFSRMAELQVGALMVASDPFFNSRREQLVGLASQHALPAVYEWREFTALGGLMSYGTSITDAYRQVGAYAGRILRGEQPAALPVLQPTKFELAINLKTAKALGLTVPQTLLVAADELIE